MKSALAKVVRNFKLKSTLRQNYQQLCKVVHLSAGRIHSVICGPRSFGGWSGQNFLLVSLRESCIFIKHKALGEVARFLQRTIVPRRFVFRDTD